jgi:hypothetical protein
MTNHELAILRAFKDPDLIEAGIALLRAEERAKRRIPKRNLWAWGKAYINQRKAEHRKVLRGLWAYDRLMYAIEQLEQDRVLPEEEK